MTDPINTLPWEGFAYLLTDRHCMHYQVPRYMAECSVCVREVLVQVATKAAKEERARIVDNVERFNIGIITKEDLPKYIAAHIRSQLC